MKTCYPLFVAIALAGASVAHAVSPPGTFPFRCDIYEVCKSDNDCVRPGISAASFVFDRKDGGYFLESYDGKREEVAYFGSRDEADDFLRKTKNDDAFEVIVVPITNVADGAAFDFYSLRFNDNKSSLPKAYTRTFCDGQSGLY